MGPFSFHVTGGTLPTLQERTGEKPIEGRRSCRPKAEQGKPREEAAMADAFRK
jgi:hypothetical protein